MNFLPILVAAALLVLAVAFGLHCFVVSCDKPKVAESKQPSSHPQHRSSRSPT